MKNLKKIRIDRGIKQETIAKYLNINNNTYSRYENGHRNMTPDTLIKLSEFFNVSSDYLIGIINMPLTPKEYEVYKELDDSEAILKKGFNLKLAGETLSEEEARKILEFIKILRDN